jgi:hypothetical protein
MSRLVLLLFYKAKFYLTAFSLESEVALNLIIVVKAEERSRGIAPPFLTLALDGGEF